MGNDTQSYDLARDPIHLDTVSGEATPLMGFGFDGPSFGQYIEDHCATA